MPKTGNTSGVT